MNNGNSRSHEFQRTLDQLQTLRDRLRLKVHLGGMDAQERWARLEVEAEKASREVTRESQAILKQVARKLRALADSLDRLALPSPPPTP